MGTIWIKNMDINNLNLNTMNVILAIIAVVLAVAGIVYFSKKDKSAPISNSKSGGSVKHKEKQDNL